LAVQQAYNISRIVTRIEEMINASEVIAPLIAPAL